MSIHYDPHNNPLTVSVARPGCESSGDANANEAEPFRDPDAEWDCPTCGGEGVVRPYAPERRERVWKGIEKRIEAGHAFEQDGALGFSAALADRHRELDERERALAFWERSLNRREKAQARTERRQRVRESVLHACAHTPTEVLVIVCAVEFAVICVMARLAGWV